MSWSPYQQLFVWTAADILAQLSWRGSDVRGRRKKKTLPTDGDTGTHRGSSSCLKAAGLFWSSSGADLQKAKGQPSVAYRPPARSPEWGKTPSGPFTAPPSHSPYYSEASNHMSPQALVQIIGKGDQHTEAETSLDEVKINFPSKLHLQIALLAVPNVRPTPKPISVASYSHLVSYFHCTTPPPFFFILEPFHHPFTQNLQPCRA